MTPLEAAQSYAERGWSVLPIPPKSKAPTKKNWQNLRLKPQQFGLFRDNKNIGVLLGEPSGGLIDIDLDHPLAVELADVYLPPSAAEFGRASKPRSHRLFRVMHPVETEKWAVEKSMIVELRSTGCQTVFPGSVHPSGEPIEWHSYGDPTVADPDELRAQVDALYSEVRRRLGVPEQPHASNDNPAAIAITGTDAVDRARRYLAKVPPAISQQGGHSTTFHAACVLVLGFGLEREQALALLGEWNATCQPPWTDKELEHKIDEALKQPGERGHLLGNRRSRNRRTKDGDAATKPNNPQPKPEPPPFVPFPVDVLPEPARQFVYSAAAALGCDHSYIALPILIAMAAAVGNSRRVKLKASWCEVCVFWGAIVGESGTLKSPALDLALAPLRFRQVAASREYEQQEREFERWSQLYEADLAEWKKKGRKNDEPPPEKPQPPVWQQILAEDTTVEAIAVLLADQPRGLLLARDELSGWLNSFDAYKSSRGADVAHWLSMHRAGSVQMNRKSGRKLIRVPRAAVSVCGGVQPATLAAALGGRYSADSPAPMNKPPAEHFANGLAARLLLAMPPRLPKRWTDADLTEADRAPINRRFDDLFGLEPLIDENGEPQPVDLPVTPAAKSLWVDFFNENAEEQVKLAGDLAAAWSKLEAYAPRFALLLQLVRDPASTTVDEASMTAAIELTRWFGDEAARAYGELGSNGDTAAARGERAQFRLVAWIEKHDGAATVRDVMRGLRQYRGDTGAAEAALNGLVKAERGTWEEEPTGDKGGRPTRIFRLAKPGDGDETLEQVDDDEVVSPSPLSPESEQPVRTQVTI